MKIVKKWKAVQGHLQKKFSHYYKSRKEAKDLKKLDSKLKALSKDETVQDMPNRLLRSNKSMFRFWAIGGLIVWLWFFVYQTLDIIFLVFMALIVSIAIEAIIEFFQRKIHRWISIGITYLLLIVFILWGLIFIIPFVAEQVSAVLQLFAIKAQWLQAVLADKSLVWVIHDIQWLPKYAKNSLLAWVQDPTFYTAMQWNVQSNLSQIIGTSTAYAREISSVAINFFSWLAKVIGKAAIVLTLSVLFSIEKKSVFNFIAWIAGKNKREYLSLKIQKIYKKMWFWLKGQLMLCLFIGVAVFLALLIMSIFGLDIPQKLSLAVIAGLMELVPYLWPALWGALSVIVVWLHNGFSAVLLTIGIFVVIQRAENNILVPIVMNKALGINPIVIFLSILIGWLIMGFAWVLLAVPIAVVVTMFLDNQEEKI